MKKKSFWKRCNRGFIVSMALLVAVALYVTATQLILSGQKKDIREVYDGVQALLTQELQMPAQDMQALLDEKSASSYTEDLRQKLEPYFVKDAAYLTEGAGSIVSALQTAAMDEVEITSIRSADPNFSIRIDEETATADGYVTYEAAGKWPSYEYGLVMDSHEQTGSVYVNLSASFVLEDGAWKIYRISSVYFGY